MNHTISNDKLRVVIAERGAELQSIQTPDGTEYLWQGDPAYWTSHAPNIFPYVARLTEGRYLLRGKEYGFRNHGLVRYEDLTAEQIGTDTITFRLSANDSTRPQYPYEFDYTITYTLQDNTLLQTIRVENHTKERMFFAVGGHPGFNVPLEAGVSFEDHYLEFSAPCHPYRINLAATGAVQPGQTLYVPEEDRRIRLQHDLFDRDAIVLTHADRMVTLKSDKSSRSVTVNYPDFRYIGFWHKPCTDAPYVCIEPWTSLPSREGIVENFEQQADLLSLDEDQIWQTTWSITIR